MDLDLVELGKIPTNGEWEGKQQMINPKKTHKTL